MCFKWPNHICSCASPTLLPPQFLKVSQLLSRFSLNVQSLLTVIVASEKSKPRLFSSILIEQGRKQMYFFLFLFFRSDLVIFIL